MSDIVVYVTEIDTESNLGRLVADGVDSLYRPAYQGNVAEVSRHEFPLWGRGIAPLEDGWSDRSDR